MNINYNNFSTIKLLDDTKFNYNNFNFEAKLLDVKGRLSPNIISGKLGINDFEQFKTIISKISNIEYKNLILVSEDPNENASYGLKQLPNDSKFILVIDNSRIQEYNKPVNLHFDNLNEIISLPINSNWTISELKNHILALGLIDFANIVYHLNNSLTNIEVDFILPVQLYVGAIPFNDFNYKITSN